MVANANCETVMDSGITNGHQNGSNEGATSLEKLSLNDDDKAQIDGIPVSKEWLIATIESAIIKEPKGGSRIADISCRRVDKGQGYLSIIAKVAITWSEHRDGLPSSVIVKLPTITKMDAEIKKLDQDTSVSQEQKAEMAEQMKNFDMGALLITGHRNECVMYQFLTENDQIPPVLIPRVYGSRHTAAGDAEVAFLLLEDLVQTAKTPDIMKGLTEAQCREMVRSVALLQAHGIKNHAWNDGRLKDTEIFKAFPDFASITATMVRGAFPNEFTLTDDQVKTVAEASRSSEIINAPKLIEDGKLYPALVHGDLWTNNFLFRTNSAGETTDELTAIIDWQIAHAGCMTEDLVRIMVVCLHAELRERIEQEMLRLYYETLSQCLASSGIKVPFSLDDVIKSYRKNFAIGALVAMGFGQFVLQSQQTAEANQEKPVSAGANSEEQKAKEAEKDAELEVLKRKLIRRGVIAMEQACAYALEDELQLC